MAPPPARPVADGSGLKRARAAEPLPPQAHADHDASGRKADRGDRCAGDPQHGVECRADAHVSPLPGEGSANSWAEPYEGAARARLLVQLVAAAGEPDILLRGCDDRQSGRSTTHRNVRSPIFRALTWLDETQMTGASRPRTNSRSRDPKKGVRVALIGQSWRLGRRRRVGRRLFDGPFPKPLLELTLSAAQRSRHLGELLRPEQQDDQAQDYKPT